MSTFLVCPCRKTTKFSDLADIRPEKEKPKHIPEFFPEIITTSKLIHKFSKMSFFQTENISFYIILLPIHSAIEIVTPPY